ncbi:hypothetical protein ACFWB2_32245 [Streptomyces virginiae]|uniref:hypothetical protein n=1 Tax=Streptomyces TaxID=1883 RepID=UPI000526227C|nr:MULTISPECIES: hypothetical protein [Streptomyces]MCX4714469.1 hypothetical protein [Streptomyces virginiae]MCX5272186.1 hypothetical protein [Streptomyces virginiae]MYV78202.1 hypothetical protein [Streptomyces sp. SID1046]WSC78394.1 hypothetical protein OHA56_19870 [Streptomyces virginiae]
MAIADDLKKTLTDPTPLYFAAGTADLAVQQAKKVPDLIEQLRAEAPARIEAVKNTDPKAVQEAVTAKFNEVLGAIDPKKLGETAQDLALRGVGVAAEYAVRAKETYDKVAVHGEQAVRNWRGDVSAEIVDIAVAVEPEAGAQPVSEPVAEAAADEKPVAKKPAARKSTAKKATVTADDAS